MGFNQILWDAPSSFIHHAEFRKSQRVALLVDELLGQLQAKPPKPPKRKRH